MLSKRKVRIVACLTLFLSAPVQAQAQTQAQSQAQIQTQTQSQDQANTLTQSQINSLQNELQKDQQLELKLNTQFDNQTQQEFASDEKILSLQQSLQTINGAITSCQNSLVVQQKQLQELQIKQGQLQKQLQDDTSDLESFLETFYETGNPEQGFLSYLQVLLKSTSLSDLLARWQYVSYVLNYFNQLNHKVVTANNNVLTQQSLIKEKMASIQTSLQEKKQLQHSQQQLLSSQQNLLSTINSQEKMTILSSVPVRSNINSIEQLTAEQSLETSLVAAGRKAGINPTDSNDLSLNSNLKLAGLQPIYIPGGVQSILAYAEQFLGTPYVWGGTSPNPGFDCSGFVQYIFGHFGVRLDRVSEEQYTEGDPIPESDLKPGDLVFFSTYESGASHVGIYVGNNIMIDSEAYGVSFDNITNSYWASRYLGARRIILCENS